MKSLEDFFAQAASVEFQHGQNEPGIHAGERGEMTTVYGYDKTAKNFFSPNMMKTETSVCRPMKVKITNLPCKMIIIVMNWKIRD